MATVLSKCKFQRFLGKKCDLKKIVFYFKFQVFGQVETTTAILILKEQKVYNDI